MFNFFQCSALRLCLIQKYSLWLKDKHRVVKKGAWFHTEIRLFDTRSKAEVMNTAT